VKRADSQIELVMMAGGKREHPRTLNHLASGVNVTMPLEEFIRQPVVRYHIALLAILGDLFSSQHGGSSPLGSSVYAIVLLRERR
jgi:hypothetical protein